MRTNRYKLFFLMTLLVLSSPRASWPDPNPRASKGAFEVVGITAPHQTAILACTQPARIARIEFPEGAYVQKGDVVVQLEDAVQRARTHMARITMESTLPIELERAKLVRAQRDLDRLKRLHGNDYASSKELSDALSALEIAEISHNLAIFQQAQAALDHQRESELLREFQLVAPFDAYVAAHIKHAGETIDQLEGVVRLAQLDPLLVTVDCPLDLAGSIKVGAQYPVRAEASDSSRVGTVVFASEVADGASQTFRVKLKVDNSDHSWIAGWKTTVNFGAPSLPEDGVAAHRSGAIQGVHAQQ